MTVVFPFLIIEKKIVCKKKEISIYIFFFFHESMSFLLIDHTILCSGTSKIVCFIIFRGGGVIIFTYKRFIDILITYSVIYYPSSKILHEALCWKDPTRWDCIPGYP